MKHEKPLRTRESERQNLPTICSQRREAGFNAAISGDGGIASEETPPVAYTFRANNQLLPAFSGGAALVAVMEAAHLRDSYNTSEFWRLRRPRLRRVLFQREMCSRRVIICHE